MQILKKSYNAILFDKNQINFLTILIRLEQRPHDSTIEASVVSSSRLHLGLNQR